MSQKFESSASAMVKHINAVMGTVIISAHRDRIRDLEQQLEASRAREMGLQDEVRKLRARLRNKRKAVSSQRGVRQ